MATRRMSSYVRPPVLSAGSYHVANRFSFGVSESLVGQMKHARSSRLWMERQLAWSRVSDSRGNAVIGWFPDLKDSPSAAWAKIKGGEKSAWDYGFDFASYSMARKITSTRQVREVMTDFWSNLLYIPAYEDRSVPWRYHYDSVVRAHSLGSFRNLLRATVVHPAMSGWLNNNSNTKRGINENLGRELLELYTVGRPAGYGEEDVLNSARLLTGFKVKVFDGFAASYEPNDHYVGPVKILGFTHANSSPDGRAAVNAYLDYLAMHPATAKRIAHRLCVRFVSDEPSAAIVSAVAKTYRSSRTDIRSTLRTLYTHRDFINSKRQKVRTPLEDVINAARVMNMRPTGGSSKQAFARQVIWMSSNIGQSQFSWPRPDGFPETSTTWASPARVLRSWDVHYALAGNWWNPQQLAKTSKAGSLPSSWPRTLDQLVEHQSRMLLGTPSTGELRSAVRTALESPGSRRFAKAADVSDWTMTVIRGSVLNAPRGLLR